MVCVVGNGHGDPSSEPERSPLVLNSANILGKGKNPIILRTAMGK